MTARRWFRVHSWLGVIAGLLLFVICWSGTVATLANEIDWLLNPALRAQPQTKRAPWGEIYAAAQAVRPDGEVSRLNAPRGARWAAEAWVHTPQDQELRVYINPYTGQVQGVTSYFNVQRFFRSFHMMLFLPYPAGSYLVSAFGVVLLSSMIAALLFYKRWWSRFFRLRLGHGTRALWSELHKLAGLWSLWFVLAISVTGVWYLAEQLGTDFVDADFAYPQHPELAAQSAPVLPLDDLMARAHELRPDLTIGAVAFPSGASRGLLYLDGQAGHTLVRDRANKLYLNSYDGRVIANQSASELSVFERWIHTADPLHFGDFGGLTTKGLWFVFGLLLSGLCLTGTYLHAQRLLREAHGHRRAHWPGTVAALAASSVVLLAAIPSGRAEIRGYGPLLDGTRHPPEVPLAVTAFIVCWVVLTLVVIAWWVWLLRRASHPVASRSLRPTRVPNSAEFPAMTNADRLPNDRTEQGDARLPAHNLAEATTSSK